MKPSRNTYRLPGCPAYEPQESHESQLMRCRQYMTWSGYRTSVAGQVIHAIQQAHTHTIELTTGAVY